MKIVISGTTGVGKSTTVNLLKEKLKSRGINVVISKELIVTSPFFKYFFQDLPEWGFVSQLEFLFERFKQYIEFQKKIEKESIEIVIFDRHFIEDKIFSQLNLVKNSISSFQSQAYEIVWKELISKIKNKKLDFYFLLRADFEVVTERMNKRGRKEETTFDSSYWKDLYWKYYNSAKYRKLFKNYSKNFIEIVTDNKTPDQVVDVIIKKLEKKSELLSNK